MLKLAHISDQLVSTPIHIVNFGRNTTIIGTLVPKQHDQALQRNVEYLSDPLLHLQNSLRLGIDLQHLRGE